MLHKKEKNFFFWKGGKVEKMVEKKRDHVEKNLKVDPSEKICSRKIESTGGDRRPLHGLFFGVHHWKADLLADLEPQVDG